MATTSYACGAGSNSRDGWRRSTCISDTDHYSPFNSDALWAWKSFLRGHNPILYDLGIVNGVSPPDPSSGSPSYESLEPARYAMGDTLRFARKVRFVDMEPRGDLSSTAYALAKPGKEYLVLEPSETAYADNLTVGSERSLSLKAPTAGPAVVLLKQVTE